MSKKETWLFHLINNRHSFTGNNDEFTLINTLLDNVAIRKENGVFSVYDFAAAFDLLVMAAYYRSTTHTGWAYCPETTFGSVIFYPYTNVCPSCAIKNKFHFHKAHKPQSGVIGAHTSRLLALFLQETLIRRGSNVKIFKGREPIDIILVDNTTNPTTTLLAEIKAAPLLVLPLMVNSQILTVATDMGIEDAPLYATDNSQLFNHDIKLYLPYREENTNTWEERAYTIGSRKNREDEYWAYRGFTNLLCTKSDFFANFVSTWKLAFDSYNQRNQDAIYWLTNACGQPSPKPENWPRRKGSGYQSVSDGKTSVGMDRTDDLKKATYQVLKIGAEGHPTMDYSLKVGVISNIHAARHFDDYLLSLKDIIWTKDTTGQVKLAKDLNPDTPVYNLFDGIITLTQLLARDEWIKNNFDFTE